MILTPVALADVPVRMSAFLATLDPTGLPRIAARHIADSLAWVIGDSIALTEDPRHHAAALALLGRFGMGVRDGAPTDGLTWDGRAVARAMEPSVIIHDAAHFQLAAPDRRHLPDFGMGAGPESGDRIGADSARRLTGVACDIEEALVSLQGILWEVELAQPAILAFLEQNWLEGGASPRNRDHFNKIIGHLRTFGFIDDDARPTMKLRTTPDARFFDSLLAG